MRRSRYWGPLGIAALLSTTGCSYGFRVATVPTLDTNGRVGFQATVGVGGGISAPQKSEHERVGYLGVGAELGGGVLGTGAANYALAGGLDYVEVARNPGTLGFRFGAYAGAYGTSLPRTNGLFSLRAALQMNVARPSKDQFVMLGILGQWTLRDPQPTLTEVGLGLVLDWNFVESWSLPSCQNAQPQEPRFARRR